MGRLSESFSALFARIGFQAQVNVHVVLQLDPGAKLLLTPERECGVSSSRLNGTFDIETSGGMMEGEGAEVDWHSPPNEEQ